MIAGGGTGGHLYPGIAVAREILSRDATAAVTFAGTAQGIEHRVLPREGFELDLVRSGGIKGKPLAGRLKALALLPIGAIDAWRILSRRRPGLVIGLGGYSSGPVVLMAAMRGMPTLLMEQNAVPGLTNRLLGRVARAVAVTFESTGVWFGRKGFVAGNPVRAEFDAVGRRALAEGVMTDRPGLRLLVFGGSQGAHAINVAMAEAAPLLSAAAVGITVTHQTGARDVDLVRTAYEQAGLAARVEPFLFAMAQEMAEADLVVCRAGATTVAEITAAARPSVLVPLPTATDDHQRRNADILARAGAAEVLDQSELTGQALAGHIVTLARSPQRRWQMAQAARTLARPDAAQRIVDRVLALARA